MTGANPLAALFQTLQSGQAQDPSQQQQGQQALAQMMNPQALPSPTMIDTPPPDITPSPQLPGGAPPNTLPLDSQVQALSQQVEENLKKLQTPIQSEIPPELADFNKYNEARYQQTYGGGGVLGTAGRALANFLSGYTNGGKTIKDTLTEQNRKDWQVAVQAEAQRVQLQKAQLAQATQLQVQQLNNLKLQQQMQYQASQTANAAANTALKAQGTPEAKDAEEKKRREDVIQTFADAGRPLSEEDAKFYRANGKLPNPTDKALPGSSSGADILATHPEATSGGKTLDPKLTYRQGRIGDVHSYEPSYAPGYMTPQTTTSERPVTIGDTVQSIPFSSTKGPSTAPTTAPVTPSKPQTRVLGPSGAEQKRAEEPTYTPEGQKAIAESQPVIDMLTRAKTLLDPVKDVNQPLQYAVDRLGYAVGYATDAAGLINKLELEKVVGAARVLKGSSRAVAALELAMQHLPNPKIDSSKLMYEKINTILENLNDIQKATDKYERKYPGRTDNKPDQITKPMSAEDFMKKHGIGKK